MTIAAKLAQRLKSWVMSRPNLDVDEGATWFLFSFVYALGLSSGELGIKFSGIIPQLSVPQVNLAMVFLCLALSIIIFVEPLLPSRMSTWTKNFRRSSGYGYQYLRRWSMFIAFILGWLAGFTMITNAVPELSWLTAVIGYMGIGIFLVLLVRISLAVGLGDRPRQPEKD